MQDSDEEYFKAARDSITFINNKFRAFIPCHRRNTIFIGAKTGEGKSTCAANIALSTIKQNKKVLMLVNEECVSDVLNRITCLSMGWDYGNHQTFTDKQIKFLNRSKKVLLERIIVIDDSYQGGNHVTTSVEGIQGVFDKIIEENEEYGAIIIDYYQCISLTLKEPHAELNRVYDKFCAMLDNYKFRLPAPIYVFGQLHPADKANRNSFETRIKGRKEIAVRCMFSYEMTVDRINQTTTFFCHKARHSSNPIVGNSVTVGFNKGLYVIDDNSFKQGVVTKKIANIIKKDDSSE